MDIVKSGMVTLGPNRTINVKVTEGWNAISVFNPSTNTGNVTITGKTELSIGGEPSSPIVLTPGMPSVTIGAYNSYYDIDDLTISTGDGCTALIVGSGYYKVLPPAPPIIDKIFPYDFPIDFNL